MTLTRRRPQGDVARRLISNWLADSFGSPAFGSQAYEASLADTAPALNVRETSDAYVVEVELAGISPENVDVTLEGRTLTIRGSYDDSEDAEDRQGTYLLREWRTGTFLRSVALPAVIDAEKARSEVRNGELILTLPKTAQHRARRLEIGAGTTSSTKNGNQGGPESPAE